MNLSPWTVYWVLQLDAINTGLFLLLVLGLVVTAVIAIATEGDAFWRTKVIVHHDPEVDEYNKTVQHRWEHREHPTERVSELAPLTKWSISLFMVLALVNILTPSTKTMAAMLLVPAVVNSETIRKEGGELYELAKRALSDAIDAPPAEE